MSWLSVSPLFTFISLFFSLFRQWYLNSILFVTGQTGLGKSTLINTIFASHLIDSNGRLLADEPVRQTTEIQAVSHSKPQPHSVWCDIDRNFFLAIVENGVRLNLNIVDTPGYGDQINNEGW